MFVQEVITGSKDKPSREDFERIRKWNEFLPSPVEKCVHHLFEEKAQEHPHAEAVCSRDGSLSYEELDAHATLLARCLIRHGIQVDSLVPLCFEKSMWTVVAMIAVLKAGAAFVPIPCSPIGRIETIIAQISPRVILTSSLQAATFERRSESVVIVGAELGLYERDCHSEDLEVKVCPRNLAYVLFTSGSTGAPKGVQIEHQQLCTHLSTWGDTVAMNHASRVFQFGSYLFDACIDEIFMPLVYGGTICIPSEDDRMNNIAGAMTDMHVTYALFMPSLLLTLRPEDLDLGTLQTLVIAGELSTLDLLELWAKVEGLQVFNAYGPTETCVINCALNVSRYGPAVGNIGRPIGDCYWIVQETDVDRLTPIECTGELIIEGPTVGRGYLGFDKQQTEEAFIPPPSWLNHFPNRQTSRFYKTGDLAKFNKDGTIQFVGRKDLQVKLRGQRMELEEVEYQLRRHLPLRSEVVAETIHPEKHGREPVLVAFICERTDQGNSPLAHDKVADNVAILPDIDSLATQLKTQLAKALSSYMVPSAIIFMDSMPRLDSSKTNRARLREIGIDRLFVGSEDIDARLLNSTKDSPSTDMEAKLQKVWAEAFRLDSCSIGVHDHFFHLGGDSITAIRLVAVARRSGLSFTVSTLLDRPNIAMLATVVQPQNDGADKIAAPYSLIKKDHQIHALRTEASVQCGIITDAVQDIYPFPKHYEVYMAIPKLIAGIVFPLPQNIDLDKYLDCWESLIKTHEMLRTRIIQTPHAMHSVVERYKPPSFRRAKHLASFLIEEQTEITMSFGEPLSQYCIISDPVQQTQYFIWTAQHAIWDAWSLRIIASKIALAYSASSQTVSTEYPKAQQITQHFQTLDPEPANRYWLKHYAGANFRPLFSPQPRLWLASQHLPPHHTTVLPSIESAFTAPTLIAVAWALVLSRHARTLDVPLGIMRSGRTLPISNISNYIGTLVTLYPWRVHIDQDALVQDFLAQFQRDMWESTEYEYIGLGALQELCPEAKEAMEGLVYLNIHPSQDEAGADVGGGVAAGEMREVLPRPYEVMFYPKWQPLRLEIELENEGFVTTAWFDECVGRGVVEGLMAGFETAYGTFVNGGSRLRLKDVGRGEYSLGVGEGTVMGESKIPGWACPRFL